MKYEVIGWTSYQDDTYPWRDGTVAIDKVVERALREGGYRFSGFDHQYREGCVPVLNDGSRVVYSMRGWGYLMAQALNAEGGRYDYMDWYMYLGDEKDLKYPKPYVDKSRIVADESLAEVFEMKLRDLPFELIKCGKKRVEVRLLDQKRQKISPGDYIVFSRENNPQDKLKVRVMDIAECYTFDELFKSFRPEDFGYDQAVTAEQFTKDMYAFYTPQQEEEFGVVGIVIAAVK